MNCIFCFRADPITVPWCSDNPGHGCSFGMHHEFLGLIEVKPVPQPKKSDGKLCAHCGLHPKNPLSSTNGCQHSYSDTP